MNAQSSLTFRTKQTTTVCTEEVLWVPGLIQRCQYVLENQADIEKLHIFCNAITSLCFISHQTSGSTEVRTQRVSRRVSEKSL